MDFKSAICKEEKNQLKLLADELFFWLRKKNFFNLLIKKQLLTEDDIKSEIIVCILSKKEYLCQERDISFSLLCTIVKNHFLDLNKRRRIEDEKQKISYTSETISEDERITVEELLVETHNFPSKFVEILYIEEIVNLLKTNLSDREKETLCFQIKKLQKNLPNPFLKNLSEDAKYQAYRRLKQKIRKILKDDPMEEISREGAVLFIKLFESEVCQKIVNN